MRIVLVPSSVSWIDSEIGGFPADGVIAASGDVGSGKTSLALGFALSSLERGRTCFLTNDSPETLIETCGSLFEHDLRPHLVSGRLTLLRFAPFFSNKVRSLSSVEGPLAELSRLVVHRRVQHVVFDTFDPMFTWVDSASATTAARAIVGMLRRWGVSVLCTMTGTDAALLEFARAANGSVELTQGELLIHHADWCNVQNKGAPVQLVQGRGLVVRSSWPDSASPTPEADPACTSLITDSMQILRVDKQEWTALWDDLVPPSAPPVGQAHAAEPAPLSATRAQRVTENGVREGDEVEAHTALQGD